MFSFVETLNDPTLNKLVGRIKPEMSDRLVPEFFKRVIAKYPMYDTTLLWLLMYQHENNKDALEYIDKNYAKFHQIYDSGFIKKLAKKDCFSSHMWEMIICDILSGCGELIPKKEKGSDFLLRLQDNTEVQVEAISVNEASEGGIRSEKPDFSNGNFVSRSGKTDDLERAVLLRFASGLKDKANTETYDKNKPLIVAINTSKAVGFTSRDNFVLRWVLFGLGNDTITRHSDGTYSRGLEQKMEAFGKTGSFKVGWFRGKEYEHISGVIYSSQEPRGFVPNGYSWHNYGMTYVANPNAINPANIDFKCMRKLIVDEEEYREEEAEKDFYSAISY